MSPVWCLSLVLAADAAGFCCVRWTAVRPRCGNLVVAAVVGGYEGNGGVVADVAVDIAVLPPLP